MKQQAVHSIIDSWQDFEPCLKLPRIPISGKYSVICGGSNNTMGKSPTQMLPRVNIYLHD